jgi:hypothetical protein
LSIFRICCAALTATVMRRMGSLFYRPSSCHGIVGSDGTRRMMRGRSITMSFGGVGGFTSFGPRRSKVRCGFSSRASAASLSLDLVNRAPAVR